MSERSNNLPKAWAVVPVQELFDIVGGGTPSTAVPEYWQGNIPWITSADIDERHKITPRRSISERAIENSATNLVPVGSVVVVTRVGLGKVGIAETRLCFSQDSQALILPRELLNPTYVLFYMGTVVGVFKHISRGTTISGVTKKQLANLEFRLPPLPEQRRIVEEIEKQFTRLEAGVAALKRVQANLKRYRAAVLKAAVEGRLIPTEAELARREGRSYEHASELLKRILAECRARWETDQLAKFRAADKEPKDDKWKAKFQEPTPIDIANLPALPVGWVWASLEQLSWDASYGTSEKCDYAFSGPPVLRIPNVEKGRIDLDDLKHSSPGTAQSDSDALSPGDFLIIRTNGSRDLIGRAALINRPFDRPHLYASYLIRFRLAASTGIDPWVGEIWDSSSNRIEIEKAAATTAGQYNLNIAKLGRLVLPLPPIVEQSRIVAEIERRTSVIDELEMQVEADLKRAERLRQAVLKRAFEGKLVAQDPNDEPASVLLERIRAERASRSEQQEARRKEKPRPSRKQVARA